jgi:putative hydrolase of the HAD superfamily
MMIFFDIDQTLIDQRKAEAAAARELLALYRDSLGQKYSVVSFCRAWDFLRDKHAPAFFAGVITSQEQRRLRVRELFGRVGWELSDREADDCFALYARHYCRHWTLFDDVLPCLRALSQHRIGIISNGNAEQQKRKLAQTGIAAFFAVTVVSQEVGAAKPHPDIFRAACRIAGCAAEQSIYVGDRLHVDALASQAAGMRGVWLDRRRTQRPATVQVVTSLTELCAELCEAP